MFPSQMVHLKIVLISNGPLYPYFPRKIYSLKLFSSQIVHFIHVSLANGYALKLFSSQMIHFIHVSVANGTPENCFPLKWSTLSMFPSQMVRLKIDFPLKWSTLSMFPSNGMP